MALVPPNITGLVLLVPSTTGPQEILHHLASKIISSHTCEHLVGRLMKIIKCLFQVLFMKDLLIDTSNYHDNHWKERKDDEL